MQQFSVRTDITVGNPTNSAAGLTRQFKDQSRLQYQTRCMSVIFDHIITKYNGRLAV